MQVRKTRGFPDPAAMFLVACMLIAFVWSPAGLVNLARAQGGVPTASIVLPTDKFSEKAAAVLNHLARENLKRAREYELINLREILDEGAVDSRLATHAKAVELLASGKDQYDNLELDAAIEELSASVEMFHKAAGRLGNGEKYMEALLFLGAAYILSGDNEQGTRNFKTVALYDKRKVLDAKVFPPSMIGIFNKVKEEVTTSPMGTVLIKSSPSAAEVYLNGVFKGITPITLIKIPEGTHFIRLEKDGFLPWGQRVDFYATHEETREASLQPSPLFSQLVNKSKPLLTDLDEDPPEKPLLEFGAWLRVEKLVVISVKQRGDKVSAEAALVQMEPPKRLAYRTATFNLTGPNFLARIDAFVASLYRKVKMPSSGSSDGKDFQLPVAVARCNSDSDCTTEEVCDAASGRCIPYAPEADALYEKWWFWTIVGGGLAVAGGTAVLVWYLMQPEEGAIEFSF